MIVVLAEDGSVDVLELGLSMFNGGRGCIQSPSRQREEPMSIVDFDFAVVEGLAASGAWLASLEKHLESGARWTDLGVAVETLDDETLVNMVSQVSPFDTVAKQALLEAPTIDDRSELLIQFMQFFRMHQQQGGDDRATLQ